MGDVIGSVLAALFLISVLAFGLKNGSLPGARIFSIVRRNEKPNEFLFMIVLVSVGAILFVINAFRLIKMVHR